MKQVASKEKTKKVFTDSEKARKTLDGFKNFAAKLGISAPGTGTEDNLIGKGEYIFNLVTRNRVLLEAAYRGSWIVGRVIGVFANDMTRAGITVNTNKGADKLEDFKKLMSRLKIMQSINSNIRWGRLYGGSVAVVQIKGQNPETPIDLDKIGKDQFQGLVVYDRWQLYPVLSEIIDSGPDMGLPAYYDIVLGSNLNDPGNALGSQETTHPGSRVRVHHSRCIRIIGVELPFFQAITEMMWGESVLEQLWDRLIAFDDVSASVSNLISRAQLRTVSVDGLREILAGGGEAEDALIRQFEYMRQFQNNEGITLLDKLDDFASTAYSFAGLSDVMLQKAQELSGASGIPLVVLFGQSPAGLNATGESDLRLYYDAILSHQEATLRNAMEMVIKVLWRSMTGKAVPDDLTFDFVPLWQMTAIEKSTIAKANAETIIETHDAGLVSSAVAMKELKQSSGEHGLFSNISDEDINSAEDEIPPPPDEDPEKQGGGAGEPGEDPTKPNQAKPKKKKAGDSAWRRIRKWLTNDKDADGYVGVVAGFSKGDKVNGTWDEDASDGEAKFTDYIRKVGSKWVVYSHTGKHLGEYSSEGQAKKRLAQIEYFKHESKDDKDRAAKIKDWAYSK